MRINGSARVFVAAVLITGGIVHGEEYLTETSALQSQVKSYEAKIKEVSAKIEHEKKKAAGDSASYAAYVKDLTGRCSGLQVERDSLLGLTKRLRDKRDSLEREEAVLGMQKQSVVRGCDALLATLRHNCRQFVDTLALFAPFNIGKQIDAIRFLEGEMAAGTITSGEALERYWHVFSQIEKASYRVETWSGASPTPAIKGDVRFLRIGFVWLGCIENSNSRAVLYDTKKRIWQEVKDPSVTSKMVKAIQVASGMASPQLVPVPFEVGLSTIQKKAEE